MNMRKPLFSCIIPVKGVRPFLGAALSSLKSQGLGDNLEIIVQDADVVPDLGQSDGINKGMSKANGEWLFWLNADDILLRNSLSKVQSAITANPSARWICANTVYMDTNDIITGASRYAKWRWCYGRHFPVWSGGPSSFFRRDLWLESGGCDTELRFVMDIDLWIRWAEKGERFLAIDDYIWGFRQHAGSLTGSGINLEERHREYLRMLSTHGIKYSLWHRNLIRIQRLLDAEWLLQVYDCSKLSGLSAHML